MKPVMKDRTMTILRPTMSWRRRPNMSANLPDTSKPHAKATPHEEVVYQ